MTDTARYIWLGVTIGTVIAAMLPPYIVAVSALLFVMGNPYLYRPLR